MKRYKYNDVLKLDKNKRILKNVTIVSHSRASFANSCWKETAGRNRQTQHAGGEAETRHQV